MIRSEGEWKDTADKSGQKDQPTGCSNKHERQLEYRLSFSIVDEFL